MFLISPYLPCKLACCLVIPVVMVYHHATLGYSALLTQSIFSHRCLQAFCPKSAKHHCWLQEADSILKVRFTAKSVYWSMTRALFFLSAASLEFASSDLMPGIHLVVLA